jgi:hypothetical protein
MLDARYGSERLASLAVRKLRKLLTEPLASPQSKERIISILQRIEARAESNHRQRAANDNHRKTRAKSNHCANRSPK